MTYTIMTPSYFSDKVTPSCLRRRALDSFKRNLPDDGEKAYQRILVRADLGTILHKRDQNAHIINAVEQSTFMSSGRDVNAPIDLFFAGTQKLY